MSYSGSKTHKRALLIRGIYEEAYRTNSSETAYALFHDLKVMRAEVDSHLGYQIGYLYQVHLDGLKRAPKRGAAA